MVLLSIILAPLLGLGLLFLLEGEDKQGARRIASGASGVSLLLTLYLFSKYVGPGSLDGFAYQVQDWIPSALAKDLQLGITFSLGVNGLSLVMTLLNALVLFTGCLVSYGIEDRPKEFYACLLALGAGVFGVFLFEDLFWFFLSYELAVVPMFLLIGTWGSKDRERASMTLNLYLTTGAFLALAGLLWTYFAVGAAPGGGYTFHLPTLVRLLEENPAMLSLAQQKGIFFLLFLGFASLAPMWPFHTWSPMGHAAAPSAASMMHAGVLMKLGSFAILRVAIPLAPEGAKFWLPIAAVFGCFNILWGGLVAMAQKDVKFMIGYSSSSHMGYVILGICSMNLTGMTGAAFLLFAHGIMTALAFATIGFFYDQTHTRDFSDLGGLASQIPFVGGCFAIMAMASAGLPGFANFASELLVLIGLWNSTGAAGLAGASFPFRIHAVIGLWGIVVGSVYLLRAVQDVFLGPPKPRWDDLEDAKGFQKFPFTILIATLLLTGCYPPLVTVPLTDGLVPILSRLF